MKQVIRITFQRGAKLKKKTLKCLIGHGDKFSQFISSSRSVCTPFNIKVIFKKKASGWSWSRNSCQLKQIKIKTWKPLVIWSHKIIMRFTLLKETNHPFIGPPIIFSDKKFRSFKEVLNRGYWDFYSEDEENLYLIQRNDRC